jgi:iron complex outermembrane recepter protein
VRNVADADQAVRGFYFGLEPPAFANELYFQRGDGRLAGITARWRW